MLDEHSGRIGQFYRLTRSLLGCRSVNEVFQTSTETLGHLLGAKHAILWKFSAAEGSLSPEHIYPDDNSIKTRTVPLGMDYLGEVFRSGNPRVLSGDGLKAPNKHVQVGKDRAITSSLCVPFKGKSGLEGIFELIDRKDDSLFKQEDADFVTQAFDHIMAAAVPRKAEEDREKSKLDAITQLTLLYDIGQVFNSTLELTSLLPVIGDKVREILEANTCTVWLLDGTQQSFNCGQSSGAYSELFSEFQPTAEDDILGDVLKSEQGLLLQDASTAERLTGRFENAEESGVVTYMATPLQCKDSILGIIECLNRENENEKAYTDEDLFLLEDLAKQAASAIYNANLLDAERKAKELDVLLEISQQITSTLNLDKILLTLVNQSAKLIPFDRASVALAEKNKVHVAAVSGKMEVDRKSDENRLLEEMLTWASHLEKGFYISEFEGKIATDREENREKFKEYFEKTGYKSTLTVPLKDEEGDLGILCFESATPYFLDERHLEVVSLLANQATVAVRNANLYRQVPLLNLMEPIMQRKAKLMKMPQSRKIGWGVAGLVLLLLLIFVPWNMKIDGDATVLPSLRMPVVAEVEGIVEKVYYHEGQAVKKGTVIAALQDQDYKLNLENAKMRRDVLQKEISKSESTGDSAASRLQRIQFDQTQREVAYYQLLLDCTKLTAPADGILITPRIEELAGKLFKRGDVFCELADMRTPRAEVSVDESDAGYMQAGQKIRLKMNSYPTMKFYGDVTRLGAQVLPQSAGNYRLEARINNPDLLLKSGMVGKAKVEVGSHSIGYVILRKPFRFIWKKLWVWLP